MKETKIESQYIDTCFVKLYEGEVIKKIPFLTVLVPVFKHSGLFVEAIASLIGQVYTDFFWDILIIDNEVYDGRKNEIETLVKKIKNGRMLYYRSLIEMDKHDIINWGLYMARGKWVMVLNEDEVLTFNAVCNMGKSIRFLEKVVVKPVGIISVPYVLVEYDEVSPQKFHYNVKKFNDYVCSLPVSLDYEKITMSYLLVTTNIDSFIAGSGTTYNREAVLNCGGITSEWEGLSDIDLLNKIKKKYQVFHSLIPYGFRRLIKDKDKSKDIINSIYLKFKYYDLLYDINFFTRAWKIFFSRCNQKKITIDAIKENKLEGEIDINDVCKKTPNRYLYVFYRLIIVRIYEIFKINQAKRLGKRTAYKKMRRFE